MIDHNNLTYRNLIELVESQSGGDPAIARDFITYALSAGGLVEKGWTPVHSEAALLMYRLTAKLGDDGDVLAHFIRGSMYGTYCVQENWLHQTKTIHQVPREQLAMGIWVKLACPTPDVFKLEDAVPGTYERAVLDLREALDNVSLVRNVPYMTKMVIERMSTVLENIGFNTIRDQCDLEEHVPAIADSWYIMCEYINGKYAVHVCQQHSVNAAWYHNKQAGLSSVFWAKQIYRMTETEASALRSQTVQAVREALDRSLAHR